MKVDNLRRKESLRTGKRERKLARGLLPQSVFSSTLQAVAGREDSEELDGLLASIDEAARKLLDNPSLEGLETYRHLVGEFVRRALRFAYRIKEQTGFDHLGNRRVYVIASMVNRELVSLTEEVLRSQRAGIDLVTRLDEIRGMLLDLYS